MKSSSGPPSALTSKEEHSKHLFKTWNKLTEQNGSSNIGCRVKSYNSYKHFGNNSGKSEYVLWVVKR